MRKILGSLYLLFYSAAPFAQAPHNFTGAWEGKLNAGIELRIIFHIKDNNAGGLSSTADSPDQSAYGMRCDTTFVNAENLTIEMHLLNASFTGKLINDSVIEGSFKQGVDLSLTLYRKKNEEIKLSVPEQPQIVPYKVTAISVPAKDVILSGTLFQPATKETSPVVLIIAGSGPTDRDGNSAALPGKNNSLLQLADSLARNGIASLRYDKRGIGKSKATAGLSEKDLRFDDMVMDAMTMYDWLKKNGYKNIYIAGHSEGSLIGMIVSTTATAKGFISIAGAGRKAGDILKAQLDGQLSASLKIELASAIDSLEHGLTVTKVDPSLFGLLRPSVQPYMKSWMALDPPQLISQLKCPVLVIQGTNDLQIKEIDAQNLNRAAKKSTLVLVKNMNHVLKKINSDKLADNTNAYSNPALPIDDELVKAIISFINQTSR